MKPNDTVYVRVTRSAVIRGTIYAVQTTLTERAKQVDYQVQYLDKSNCTKIETFSDQYVFETMQEAFNES